MNWIFGILFNLLLFNGCLTVNIDRDSLCDDVQQQNTSENMAKFSALNEDFEYAMFENSNVQEILQFAKHSRASDFVKKHIFPVKYQNYMFTMIPINDGDVDEDRRVLQRENDISIYGDTFILDIIQFFGRSIKKLHIFRSNLISEERSATIHRNLNEYCADSLTELNLGATHENALTQFQKPFSKLERLHIHIQKRQMQPIRPLNEIFPRLKELTFEMYDSSVDFQFNVNEFIGSEIPYMEHLEYLDIEISLVGRSEIENIENQIEKMLNKNPQIRGLAYKGRLGNHLINAINEYLPNLDNFSINAVDSETQPISLDHVKHFFLRSGAAVRIERFSFPQLDTVSMVYSYQIQMEPTRKSWIEFFKNHQNLRKLNCHLYDGRGIADILDELPNLQEMQIRFYPQFAFNLISRLIESHRNLLKFEFQIYITYQPDDPDMAIYREKFENEWHISYCRGDYWPTLTFERKTN